MVINYPSNNMHIMNHNPGSMAAGHTLHNPKKETFAARFATDIMNITNWSTKIKNAAKGGGYDYYYFKNAILDLKEEKIKR